MWADIQRHLSGFGLPLRKTNLDIVTNDDVRPTTEQLTVRIEGDELAAERMRWGLVPFWRNGKPLKDTEKGKGDGFKLTTFNCNSPRRTPNPLPPSRAHSSGGAASCLQAAGSSGLDLKGRRPSTVSPAPMASRCGSPACGTAASLQTRAK